MRLVLIHPVDPRGTKVGGIETHVLQILRRRPADMPVLLVGVDESGTLELGRVHRIRMGDVPVDFLPVLSLPPERLQGAAKSLGKSVTLRFALALLQRLPQLRREIGRERVTVEIERIEFAPVVRLLGCPVVLIVHQEGDPRTDKMDSILSRYWMVNSVTERLAVWLAARIFCVTPKIRDRYAERYPSIAAKAEVLTVSVDTEMFKATPFNTADGILRVIYAGRLDEFKDPTTMFGVIQRLDATLGGAVEFHYCGSADPERFPAFNAIRDRTVRHGALTSPQVAAAMRAAHVGILTSHWEGMPCFLLELLASGRPFGGLELPQYHQVVTDGVNGQMVARSPDQTDTETRVAAAILGLWDEIRAGRLDPAAIGRAVLPWSVDQQLNRLFAAHRAVARGGPAPATPSEPALGRAS